MFGWLSAASVCASRVNRATRSASRASASGNTLMATWRLRLRVASAVHLAHAAGAKRRDDLVGAKARAARDAHGFNVPIQMSPSVAVSV